MRAPFLILALPRSRTAWLSRFLTYGDWSCGHDELKHVRQLEDVKSWLSQPCAGSAETAAAPFWRLALHYRPDLRLVTIRRDPEEVAQSIIRSGLMADADDAGKLARKLDHKLDQIERCAPNVLSVQYEDLNDESACAGLFEHCLPYRHNSDRWEALRDERITINVPTLRRYVTAHAEQIDRIAGIAKQKSLSLISGRRPKRRDGLSLQIEAFDDFYRDSQHLFREHCAEVGEHPDAFAGKNIPLMRELASVGALQVLTARSNGRVFGYLMTVLSPSLVKDGIKSAYHTTFFASPDFPGLGLKLQREALNILRSEGTNEVLMRAGTRGAGSRTASLYKRLGAEECGELFRLEL